MYNKTPLFAHEKYKMVVKICKKLLRLTEKKRYIYYFTNSLDKCRDIPERYWKVVNHVISSNGKKPYFDAIVVDGNNIPVMSV